MSKTIKILLMRHAESAYNKIQYDWFEKNNLDRNREDNE